MKVELMREIKSIPYLVISTRINDRLYYAIAAHDVVHKYAIGMHDLKILKEHFDYVTTDWIKAKKFLKEIKENG